MASKGFGKIDIVHHLAGRYGYRSYLELAAPTTGHHYKDVDRARLVCHRLMQVCPPEYSDGMPIDYRCPGEDLTPALEAIAATGARFDVMLVDPWHTYAASANALHTAFGLLEPGGAMVVHDCMPPTKQIASPVFVAGEWCGSTYAAFLDFVLDRKDLRYLTVDADYGCGVVRKIAALPDLGRRNLFARWWQRRARAAWQKVADDSDSAWRVFRVYRKSLLRITTPHDFVVGRHTLG